MSELKYGNRVNVSARYQRKFKSDHYKYWESVPANYENAIFLGYRFLKNGTAQYEEYSGYLFREKETFKAALINPGPNLNNVYVPLDAISTNTE